MKSLVRYAAAAAVGAAAAGSVAFAQMPAKPPRAVVTLYRAAPGQQVALVHWLADQDRIAAAAGVAGPTQLYVHTDGDSWDFMTVRAATSPAQDDAIDAAARKMGLPSGPRVGLELRKYLASHTDTYTIGPITPVQYLAAVGS